MQYRGLQTTTQCLLFCFENIRINTFLQNQKIKKILLHKFTYLLTPFIDSLICIHLHFSYIYCP